MVGNETSVGGHILAVADETFKAMRAKMRRRLQSEIGKSLPRTERRRLARETEKKLRERARLMRILYTTSYESGAGLLADKQLREFLVEYNSRIAKEQTLPGNFEALKDFFFFDKKCPVFVLKPEVDHLFSFADFIDFATSSDCHTDPIDYADLLENGVIYSFNNYEPTDEMTISTDRDHEFGIGAVSIIKNGSSLNVFATAGIVSTVESLLEEDVVTPSSKEVHPLKKNVLPHPDYIHEPSALRASDSKFLHKTLAMVRFNTTNKTKVCQYVLRDWGDHFDLITDDPSPMMLLPEAERQRLCQESTYRLLPYTCLLELCSTFLALPQYFKFKIDLVKEEEPVRAKEILKETYDNIFRNRMLPEYFKDNFIKIRRVSALRIKNPVSSRPIRRYVPPSHQVEVQGYWRNLPPGSWGTDANGQKIEGKTWIKGHFRWLSLPEKPKEVLLKSKISLARVIAASEELFKSVSDHQPPRRESNAVHPGLSPTTFSKVSRETAYFERKKLTTKLRFRILDRDDYRCVLCGADAAMDSSVRLDVDHIVPISEGGKTTPENLRTLCSRCNNGKGAALV
jgi:hypothetical protein